MRRLTGLMFMFAGIFITIGWIWLPVKYKYDVQTDNPNIYTNLTTVWAWTGMAILLICTCIQFFRWGIKFYDWLEEPWHPF